MSSYIFVAPFITSIQPNDVQDIYLIFALDSCARKRQSRKSAEENDALDNAELKELQRVQND